MITNRPDPENSRIEDIADYHGNREKVMNWQEYRAETASLAVYQKEIEIEYLAGQLISESAEFLGVLNKCYRKYGKQAWEMFKTEHRDAAILELGDVFWYLARLSDVLKFEYEIQRSAYQTESFTQQIHGLVRSATRVNQYLIADETLWGDKQLLIILATEELIDCYNIALLFLATLNTTLDEVCDLNIKKLENRKKNKTLTRVTRNESL